MRTSRALHLAILASLLAACGDLGSGGGDTPSVGGLGGDGGFAVTGPVITPPELFLDFGGVFIGQESAKTFRIEATGNGSTLLSIARGIQLPADFRITPAKQEVSAGSPATFTMVFAPLDPPGERVFDLELDAPSASPSLVKVHVRGISKVRAIQTNPDPCLDFGTVMLGLDRTLPMEISNLVDVAFGVDVSVLDAAFHVDPAHLELGPRGVSQVNVRFFPSARGDYQADLLFKLCDDCSQVKRCLKGKSAIEAFVLEPDPLDFGTHAPGITTCEDISVRNTGDVSIYARDIRLDDGLKRVPGTFELRLGNILNNKEIGASLAETFQLCFTPAKLGAEYSGNVVVYTDDQVRKVAVSGRGGAAKIVAIPDHLDLGMTLTGEAVSRGVVLRNVGEPTFVEVTGVTWTPDDGSLNVEHLGLPYDVGEDGDLALDVTFSRMVTGDFAGSITVTIRGESGSEDTLAIPITAQVTAG